MLPRIYYSPDIRNSLVNVAKQPVKRIMHHIQRGEKSSYTNIRSIKPLPQTCIIHDDFLLEEVTVWLSLFLLRRMFDIQGERTRIQPTLMSHILVVCEYRDDVYTPVPFGPLKKSKRKEQCRCRSVPRDRCDQILCGLCITVVQYCFNCKFVYKNRQKKMRSFGKN